ncbi:MAG: 50S ribosomal protein L19 [Rickettsiales bacterium]|nr:50S ribosomal protein L19 [Rickettsiales bacterium]
MVVNALEKFNGQQVEKLSKNIPNFKAGDTVKVGYKITEGNAARIQIFEGVVLGRARRSKNFDANFIVRKISNGVGVERKFPLYSPLVDKIAVVKRGVVRKGKIYYLRKLTGKSSRIEEKLS